MQQDPISAERRIGARVAVEHPATVVADGAVRIGHSVNVSTSGVLVALDDALTIWAEVSVALPRIGARPARVARSDGARFGLVFREPLSSAVFFALTGEAAAEIVLRDKPVPLRTAPHEFGRDRIKTFRRKVAEGTRG